MRNGPRLRATMERGGIDRLTPSSLVNPDCSSELHSPAS